MEASLCCSSFPSTPLQRTQTPRSRHRSTTICATISRTKKEQTIEIVKQQLENCHLLAGISYKGVTANQLLGLRRSLPDSAHLLVAKNTLVIKAIEGTPWEPLKPCMKGMNAWLFIHSEEILDVLKTFRDFQMEQKLDQNDFVGGVWEGKFYAPEEFTVLETMPSRAEIYANLLGSLQAPAIGLIGTLQAPARQILMVLKAYVQKLEKEGTADTSTA